MTTQKKCQPCTVEQKYNELLFAVGRKFTDESRHETALRYIREAEKVGAGDTAVAPTDRSLAIAAGFGASVHDR